MADYAIGDLQGCFNPLLRLLDKIQFDEAADRLWFVGDLVNRGPDSLAVLRFIRALKKKPVITLGNHDLHLLARLFTKDARVNADDTLDNLIEAADGESLGHWLRGQSLLHHDSDLNVVMCHAGLSPFWDLQMAKACALELEAVLQGEDFPFFLKNMYGNTPAHWDPQLEGMERLRVICNYFTRMRFCNQQGDLVLSYKGTLAKAPKDLTPWYEVPGRKPIVETIVFGHWAALQGQCQEPNIYAIDTGCLWGGELTALRLQDKVLFKVPGL